jgi:hypothetical protein
MRTILAVSIFLIISTAIYSLNRFGLTFSGFFKGDGTAVLQAATTLLGIWALVIGFGITAIGATIGLSNLPSPWKFTLFRKTIIRKLVPFLILLLLAGVIPFLSILHCRSDMGVSISFVTPWLIVSFFLQLLLVLSAAFAAKSTYNELTLVPAIKSSLAGIDNIKIIDLQKTHSETFKVEHQEGNRLAMIPFSGFERGIEGKSSTVHSELLMVFKTLFLEKDPQELDSGLKIVSDWIEKNPIAEIDSYLQYRLLPACFHAVRIDQDTFNPQVFRIRLYFIGRLIRILRKAGASLSASNSANPLWELIDECSRLIGMAQALESARVGVDIVLSTECQSNHCFSILLNNLTKSFQPLAFEHNVHSLYVMEWLLEWHRRYFENCLFRIWPKGRESIDYQIQSIDHMYTAIEQEYGDEEALWARVHDMRYWILITIRRIQENFVNQHKPHEMEDDTKKLAAQDFAIFDTTISKLLDIRKPQGDETGYKNVKNPENPFI